MRITNAKNTIIFGDKTGIKFLIKIKGANVKFNGTFRIDAKFSLVLENYTNCTIKIIIHPRMEQIILHKHEFITYTQDDFDENHNFWIEFEQIIEGMWIIADSFDAQTSIKSATIPAIYFN